MTQDLPEKPAETHPFSGRAADSLAHMNHDSQGFRFEPQDLRDPQRAIEALAHWDELDPSTLALLEKHPIHGPRLAMLRAADGWLEDQATRARVGRAPRAVPGGGPSASGSCPTAEELYDFGRGPGYTPLSHAARVAIDRHLAQCRQCEVLVETLVAPPPAPLDYDYEPAAQGNGAEQAHEPAAFEPANWADVAAAAPADAPVALIGGHALATPSRSAGARGPIAAPAVEPPRPRPLRRWVPLVAAASLLATAAVWTALSISEPKPLRFPENPLLRGATAGSLLFPRDHVLQPTPELSRIWPAFGQHTTFEIQPEANAQSYWVEVSKHDGSAFGANENLWRQPSEAATFSAQNELALGHYTWEAWAIVHGLDQHLGRRDFDVAVDAALIQRLLALEDKSEPERSLEAVCLLHESGYRTDARRIARSMPPSPERDAYLEQVPGR